MTNLKSSSRVDHLARACGFLLLLFTVAEGRTWTSADGSKTFEGDLKSYDPASGIVGVTLANGSAMQFHQEKLSEADLKFLKEQGKMEQSNTSAKPSTGSLDVDSKNLFKRPDDKAAEMSKPVQVFILLGQSNMVGTGKITGGEGSLENAIKSKGLYPYLVDDSGAWLERKDVRYVQMMQNKGLLENDWMRIRNAKIGPEYGIGHPLGNAIDAPVMILKSCIGNRSLGWDYLPPGSEPYEFGGKTYPGYLGTVSAPKGNGQKPSEWYAGKQYDDDTDDAKNVLSKLDTYYPGAKKYEVAGFFFWQGEKDGGDAGHANEYEKNLVRFIKQLRKDFDSPNAKFVLATLGEATKGSGGNGGTIMEAQFAVDGKDGKYPEFKGNVATVFSNPLSKGGSGNGHYGGNAETYMNVGEAMGKAMVELLQSR